MTSSPTRVILIGAARSGTKIVRDSLAVATGVGKVPYDVPFVWRRDARATADDALDPAQLTPKTKAFIARYVDQYVAGDPEGVIEKTVGNTLRVPFVAEVFPNATFVHLIRDGIDVTESTWRQWREPADYRYLKNKVRHFPLRLLPTYGRRYATSLLRRKVADDGRVATWGPRYPGIDQDLASTDLLTVCARQWRESVCLASRDLVATGAPTIEIRYEDLISDPATTLQRTAEFCELPTSPGALEKASAMIKPGRSGAGTRALTSGQLATLDHEIGALLEQLGYARTPTNEAREEVPEDGC